MKKKPIKAQAKEKCTAFDYRQEWMKQGLVVRQSVPYTG